MYLGRYVDRSHYLYLPKKRRAAVVRCLHLDRAPCFPYIRSLPLLRHRGRCLGGLERSSNPRNRLSPTPTLDHMTLRGLLPETTNFTAGRSHDKRAMKELLRRSFPVELVSSFASSTSHRFLPPTLPSSPNDGSQVPTTETRDDAFPH